MVENNIHDEITYTAESVMDEGKLIRETDPQPLVPVNELDLDPEDPLVFYYDSDAYIIPLERHRELPYLTGEPGWGMIPETPAGIPIPYYVRYPALIRYSKTFQATQLGIWGQFGQGKSQWNNRTTMYKAITNKVITIADRRCEWRNFVRYGYWTLNANAWEFTPFNLVLWLHERFEPVKIDGASSAWEFLNPLLQRKNVQVQKFSSVEDILTATKNQSLGTINALMVDGFDTISKMQVIYELFQGASYLRNNPATGHHPLFIQIHEGSELLPMIAQGEQFKLLQEIANCFLGARKDDISYSIEAQGKNELAYRIAEKYTYNIYFKPTDSRRKRPAQKMALYYKPGQCNICQGPVWAQYSFEPLAELEDDYRLYPPRLLIRYHDTEKPKSIWEELKSTKNRQAIIKRMEKVAELTDLQISSILDCSLPSVKSARAKVE